MRLNSVAQLVVLKIVFVFFIILYDLDKLIMSCFSPLLSHHSVLYIQMSNSKNQKGDWGTARTTTGRQEIRQHIRNSATFEWANWDSRM